MKVCMVVPEERVKGGIASIVNGYRAYDFGQAVEVSYVESYCDGNKWKKLVKAIKGYALFWGQLRMNRVDVVHIHSSFGHSFYRKIPFIYMAAWKKIPIINHIHGAEFEAFFPKAVPKKQKLIKKIYGKCQVLIALSAEWKQKLSLIVPEDRIVIIENYTRIPDILIETKKEQILFMGELGTRKGCFDIPAIYQKATAETGKIPLIMAGDGAKAEVQKEFAALNLKAIAEFPGWVRGEEKEKLLQESSIFLFPSYNEGMPVAVLEAMAHGLAIVSTTVGGIPKLIEDGVSGYLCSPGDIDQLAKRLRELVVSKEKRESFGRAARKQAIEKYSIESHMDRLLSLYKEVGK